MNQMGENRDEFNEAISCCVFQHLTGRVWSTRLRPYFLIWMLIM